MKEARAPWLAFTDDDCHVAGDWLEVIDRAARERGTGSVLTGRVIAGVPEGEAVTAPSLREMGRETTYTSPTFRDVLFGNNMAIPADLLRRVGGFDEGLGPGTPAPAAEDNDLGYRLLRAGVPIRYLPTMVVTHGSWRSGCTLRDRGRMVLPGKGAISGTATPTTRPFSNTTSRPERSWRGFSWLRTIRCRMASPSGRARFGTATTLAWFVG